jgi:hypothetical protein
MSSSTVPAPTLISPRADIAPVHGIRASGGDEAVGVGRGGHGREAGAVDADLVEAAADVDAGSRDPRGR